MHYTCIACITIHSVMRMKKKKIYPQVYLGECKFKSKKTKMYKFINTELKLESESEPDDTRWKSDSQLESDSK